MNIKNVATHVLKAIGLFNVTRGAMIALGLHVPIPHGHTLLLRAMDAKKEKLGSLKGCICVEIGSTRENIPGQGSTAEIAQECMAQGIHFITVDMDPENTEAAKNTLIKISQDFEAINDKGEDFLRGFQNKINFLYLDAFDIDHGKHSDKRKSRYREYLGLDISNEACYQMHLDCAKEAVRLMDVGGVIVFDDAWREGDGWGGKGHTAMPFLLKHGFEVVQETQNTIWLERRH